MVLQQVLQQVSRRSSAPPAPTSRPGWSGWYAQQAGGGIHAVNAVDAELRRLGLGRSPAAAAELPAVGFRRASLQALGNNCPPSTEGRLGLRPDELARLPTITWDESHPVKECCCCFSTFSAGSRLAVLPCSPLHVFHHGCVAEWLARHNSCPVCRAATSRNSLVGAEDVWSSGDAAHDPRGDEWSQTNRNPPPAPSHRAPPRHPDARREDESP
jgi:hypothetical protein